MLKGRHLIDIMDFSTEELDEILGLANEIISDEEKFSQVCRGKLLATLFYEPSTRTRLSFESAMMRLGGKVIGFSDAGSSSVSKGESIADTIRVISCYADIAAMRHPKEGAPKIASMYSSIPVINAGDGGHQHPTQTLADLLTIKSMKGTMSNLKIGCCGDLKFGRTVHSLIKAMSRYENNNFTLISPRELKIPDYVKKELDNKNIEYIETSSLEAAIGSLDVLYMTRVQKERFFNEEDYVRLRDSYILDKEKMTGAKDNMIVLHPLPRVNEISHEIDQDPRACYFKQVKYGMYVRMALIMELLGIKQEGKECLL
ncbi:aspartate carbamoyltransferase [Clostridium luticellarii]|jgi:aspartate carbamoyltransferase catalytic subunit|uniref:aspartate carbamoyltransferase n=2 Tax=Clostridium luticellarii TaxID=1691940 RepID=UPI0023529FEB|nr:aspartate carbamoyltransferase [Clostridium luticellarii]MCI1944438.1 aspartate carbamoyltransferase [Clostridium luticellarii]MCI1967937.1 aspartate carbamoyltransferase [Clostridium luticellarii]